MRDRCGEGGEGVGGGKNSVVGLWPTVTTKGGPFHLPFSFSFLFSCYEEPSKRYRDISFSFGDYLPFVSCFFYPLYELPSDALDWNLP